MMENSINEIITINVPHAPNTASKINEYLKRGYTLLHIQNYDIYGENLGTSLTFKRNQ